MPRKKRLLTISVDELGLCSACRQAFSVRRLRFSRSGWVCPSKGCGAPLSIASFGQREEGRGVLKSVRWVGPSGGWTKRRPSKPFEIDVVIKHRQAPRRVRVNPSISAA